jgi:hypothetical protein
MQTVLHLASSELNDDILSALKSFFREQNITITDVVITAEVPLHQALEPSEEAEEDAFFSNSANRVMLETSMREADEGKVITVDMERIRAGFHPSESIISRYATSPVH